MKPGILCLFLLLMALASRAAAQTTTTTTLPGTCDAVSVDQLQLATASDPDWAAVLAYAQRHRFDTSTFTNPRRCTKGGNVMYVMQLPNTRPTRPPASVLYAPQLPRLRRTQLYFQKSPHVVMVVTELVIKRITTNTDGSAKSMKIYDFRGRAIRTSTTTSASALRGFL